MDQRTIKLKICTIIFCVFAPSLLMIGIPMNTYNWEAVHIPIVGTGILQTTPSIDLTVTALEKNKLNQEVKQLELQNDRSLSAWFWTNISTLLSVIVIALSAVGSTIFGIIRWTRDRKVDREKRAEDRFHSVIEDLGGERIEVKIGGVVALRTFLLDGYEKFYRQIFDLTVAHLRIQKHEGSSVLPQSKSELKRLLTTFFPEKDAQAQGYAASDISVLGQVLATVFMESFLRVRDCLRQKPESIDARGVCLDKVDLSGADLKQAWMPESSFIEANLNNADLSGANLTRADFTGASLDTTTLEKATLIGSQFVKAKLTWAQLGDAILDGANFMQADLTHASLEKATLVSRVNLSEANLSEANLSEANLSEANLSEANLTGANLANTILKRAILSGTNPESAKSLQGTQMQGVIGLREPAKCKALGAILDDNAEGGKQVSNLPSN